MTAHRLVVSDQEKSPHRRLNQNLTNLSPFGNEILTFVTDEWSMNRSHLLLLASFTALQHAGAHSWKADELPVFDEVLRAHILAEWEQKQAPSASGTLKPLSVASTASVVQFAAAALANAKEAPVQSLPFQAFPKVEIKWDQDYLYIASNGLPDHNMMVGITAWQQQVPLPQSYFGDNAWRVPLHPVPAKEPVSIKARFLRGAIALAANGIPIFNPQNNRGEVSQEIGELDQWGGHCGRADDYHYHAAPLHLQTVVGKGLPIAYALDGYPIYGLTEPNGAPLGKLDSYNGHETEKLGYHYHASTQYPYVNGGFHGEVVEAEGQVDPQPRAQPVRPDTPPLRGAVITGFESLTTNSYKLSYKVNNDKRSITYAINSDGTYPFEYDDGKGNITKEVYTQHGPGGAGQKGQGRDKGKGGMKTDDAPPQPRAEERSAVTESAPSTVPATLMDFNGDGIVSAQEFANTARREYNKKPSGVSLVDAMAKARQVFEGMDHNHDGQLDRGEWQPAAPSEADKPSQDRLERGDNRGGMERRGSVKKSESAIAPDQPHSSNGSFLLSSSEVADGAEMPMDYTGDGSGATLPLEWKGVPAGTQGYALIMDHLDPEGVMKWYWTLYDLPASLTSLPKNVQGVGKVGTGFRGQIGYEPPHSKGPGSKTYVLTLYALSAPLAIQQLPREVNREVLMAAMKGKVLASSSLHVVHTSQGSEDSGQTSRKPRRLPSQK